VHPRHSTDALAALHRHSRAPSSTATARLRCTVNFELVTGAGQVHIALMNATTSLSTPRAVAISYNWETGEIQSINFDGEGCVEQARKWVEGDGPDSARSFLVDRGWEHFWRANRAAAQPPVSALADRPAARLSAKGVQHFFSALQQLAQASQEMQSGLDCTPGEFERHCHSSTPSPRCETDRNALTPVSNPVQPSVPPALVCH